MAKVCPECKEVNSDAAIRCGMCGLVFRTQEQATAAPPAAGAAPPAAPPRTGAVPAPPPPRAAVGAVPPPPPTKAAQQSMPAPPPPRAAAGAVPPPPPTKAVQQGMPAPPPRPPLPPGQRTAPANVPSAKAPGGMMPPRVGMRKQYVLNYSGFWKRFAAVLIDGFLINIPMSPFSKAVMGGAAAGLRDSGPADEKALMKLLTAFLILSLYNIMVGWAYFATMEAMPTQGTLGKMALGIKVTDLNGDQIGFGRASGRFFAKRILELFCYLGDIVSTFTISLGDKKQALHDMIAGTQVVDK